MADKFEVNATVVEIQEGGPGNAILLLPSDSTVSGPTGGGQSVSTRFTRDYKAGAGVYKSDGVVVDGDPERYTADLMVRVTVSKFIDNMKKRRCMHNLRVRQHCGAVDDFTNFNAIMALHETFGTGQTLTENIANGSTTVQADLMNSVAESATDLVNVKNVQHLDISGSHSDVAINEVISVGVAQCQGDCGDTNDGNQEYWAVTDVDTTPGYQGTGYPVFLYTEDGGTNWSASYINAFSGGNAIDVIKVGGRAIAVSADNGIAYARFADIKAGVVNPWVIASGVASTFPNAAAQASGNTLYACGNSGRIWKSTDGGLSWSLFSNGVQTTNHLLDVAFASEVVGWFGGASGTLVKYNNGALSVVVVEDASGNVLTDNIVTVAVPDDRTKEVYLGTSAGEIWRTKDSGATWENMAFDGSGTGTIEKLAFSGPLGFHLWVVQTRVAGDKSRVLRDLSGGYLGAYAEVVGSYDDPANSVMNSIAPSDVNTAVTVGELDGTYAFIGRIS